MRHVLFLAAVAVTACAKPEFPSALLRSDPAPALVHDLVPDAREIAGHGTSSLREELGGKRTATRTHVFEFRLPAAEAPAALGERLRSGCLALLASQAASVDEESQSTVTGDDAGVPTRGVEWSWPYRSARWAGPEGRLRCRLDLRDADAGAHACRLEIELRESL